MLIPIVVNIEIYLDDGSIDVAAAVIDFHHSKIAQFVNTVDGMTSIVNDKGWIYKILIPFEEMYSIYNQQHEINDTYKDEVDDFLKDNYKNTRKNNINKDGETDNS